MTPTCQICKHWGPEIYGWGRVCKEQSSERKKTFTLEGFTCGCFCPKTDEKTCGTCEYWMYYTNMADGDDISPYQPYHPCKISFDGKETAKQFIWTAKTHSCIMWKCVDSGGGH